MSALLSIYTKASDVTSLATIDVDDFLSGVQEGRWQRQVEEVRAIEDKKARKKKQQELPRVTISGKFSKKNNDGLIVHSGLMGVDIDGVGSKEEGDAIWARLINDPYTYAMFRTAGGLNIFAIVRIEPSRHHDAFDGLEKYYADKYAISIDRGYRSVSQGRDVSWDPDLFKYDRAKIFTGYLTKKDRIDEKRIPAAIVIKSDWDEILAYIDHNHVDICPDYYDWVKVGLSISAEFGELGRDAFHVVSRQSDKYRKQDCDRKYDTFLKGAGRSKSIGIGTFYWFCKQSGVPIMSEKTKRMMTICYQAKKQGRDKISAIKTLTEVEEISEVDAVEYAEQMWKSGWEPSKGKGGDDEVNYVEEIEIYLKSNYKLLRNVITERLENEGEVIKKNDYANIVVGLKELHPKVHKELIFDVLDSDRIRSYNPIHDFFARNIDKGKGGGLIKELANCIVSKSKFPYDAAQRHGEVSYVEYFLTKWLMGLIGSAMWNRSELCLVFYGKGNTGKTEFFWRLLPQQLVYLFAESPLDFGKDSELLLTQKWVIFDNEFGGKSKKDAALFKTFTSKKKVSVRKAYGKDNEDYRRLAILCGSSNASELITDNSTANRRIIPIEISKIHHEDYNNIDKTELIMECYHRYLAGERDSFTEEDIQDLNDSTMENVMMPTENEMLLKYFSPYKDEEEFIPGSINRPFNYREMTTSDIASHIMSRNKSIHISLINLGRALAKTGFNNKRVRKSGEPVKVYEVLLVDEADKAESMNPSSSSYPDWMRDKD